MGRAFDGFSDIRTLSTAEVIVLEGHLSAADGRTVRVVWDDGLKVKVGNGVWTPPLGTPEATS